MIRNYQNFLQGLTTFLGLTKQKFPRLSELIFYYSLVKKTIFTQCKINLRSNFFQWTSFLKQPGSTKSRSGKILQLINQTSGTKSAYPSRNQNFIFLKVAVVRICCWYLYKFDPTLSRLVGKKLSASTAFDFSKCLIC